SLLIGVEVARFVQVQTALHCFHRECVEVGWFCQQRENGPIVVCQDKRRPSASASRPVLVLSCPLHRAPRMPYQRRDNNGLYHSPRRYPSVRHASRPWFHV